MPLLSILKVRFGKHFKKCREHKNKIVKAEATAALVNFMSFQIQIQIQIYIFISNSHGIEFVT